MNSPAHTSDRRIRSAGNRRVLVAGMCVATMALTVGLIGTTRAEAQTHPDPVAMTPAAAPAPSGGQASSVQITESGLFGFEVGLGVAVLVVVTRKRRR